MKAEAVKNYELLKEQEIRIGDFQTRASILRHRKTGARVALMENDDENKVFYIAFRTPPENSTGVAHILEHSVLCGSEKFPLKDPFVELIKGSLNTFLNAMTYPDKTVYPVASCNDKDFQNLMDVYLDSVFHPNIYKKKAIFQQEGWHYEFDEEGNLIYNGVVYNEMKGAFSDADEIFQRQIMNALYPDTAYGVESGGDPEVIPELTYEEFLEFHSKYYHPSNSYIFLYGNMDMAEKLEFIDREYLSAYDAIQVDSEIWLQPAFAQQKRIEKAYPVDEEDDVKEKAYLSVNYSVGDTQDPELYIAFQILDRVICNINGAPLKTALLDASLGKDVYSVYDNGLRQPTFMIVAKDADESREQEFLDITKRTLEKLVREGLDQKALLASLNYFEFRYLEADFGSYPKGLMYGLQALDSWLYCDENPFIHIDSNAVFASLREKVDKGYFEGLIQNYLLENPHSAVLVMKPEKGLLQEREKALSARLKSIQENLKPEELEGIREDLAALETFRDTEDTPEILEKLPMLTREDLKKEAVRIRNEERKIGDTNFLYHDIFTNGIGYLKLLFDLREIPKESIPYIGLLRTVLFDLSTEHYTYGELSNEIDLKTGGMSDSVTMVSRYDDPDESRRYLQIQMKFLERNLADALRLAGEVILTSRLDDGKRLLEILREYISNTRQRMMSSGHVVALNRALAYENLPAAYMEEMTGLEQYRFCSAFEADFEGKKEELIAGLRTAAERIFRPENLEVDFTGSRDLLPSIEKEVERLKEGLYTGPVKKEEYIPVLEKKNEGLMCPSQVQYVCRAGNFRKKGLPYVGSLRVLKVMLGFEYLWMNIRVKNGAYDFLCNFASTGESVMVSYRDPQIKKTVEVYEGAAEYVRNFQADDRTMTKYIIGAVGAMDVPMTPSTLGSYSRDIYISGQTQEDLQRIRDEVLSASPEDIRGLAKYIDAIMEDDCFVVVGNSGKIKEAEKMFGRIENLF